VGVVDMGGSAARPGASAAAARATRTVFHKPPQAPPVEVSWPTPRFASCLTQQAAPRNRPGLWTGTAIADHKAKRGHSLLLKTKRGHPLLLNATCGRAVPGDEWATWVCEVDLLRREAPAAR